MVELVHGGRGQEEGMLRLDYKRPQMYLKLTESILS